METHYTELLESVYGGKRWILAMDALAGMSGLVKQLHDLGATSCLCVAASRGTGDTPDPEFAPDPIVFDVRGDDMMSSVRAAIRQFANLPPDAQARIDEFDPDGTARVIGTIFDDGAPLGGRTKYGARPKSWQALEDKTTINDVWDAAGVRRAEFVVADADDFDTLWDAAQRLDLGHGTVWTADMREGFHGGAAYTRRVEHEANAREVHQFLAEASDKIRVMPYLSGIPCSIHGIVFDDYTVVLRPCEMIVFRRADSPEFQYGRAATFWDPTDAQREQMRSAARAVGDHLRDERNYRGAFTIDGIMTDGGFMPTELNPRYGAALGVLTRAVKLPMMLVNLAVVEGESFDWRAPELEAFLLEAADEHRFGGTMAIVHKTFDETVRAEIVFDADADDGGDGEFREATDEEEPHATVMVGPHSAGGFLMIDFIAEKTPVGPSVAARAVAALRWADERWDLGIGELEPATN